VLVGGSALKAVVGPAAWRAEFRQPGCTRTPHRPATGWNLLRLAWWLDQPKPAALSLVSLIVGRCRSQQPRGSPDRCPGGQAAGQGSGLVRELLLPRGPWPVVSGPQPADAKRPPAGWPPRMAGAQPQLGQQVFRPSLEPGQGTQPVAAHLIEPIQSERSAMEKPRGRFAQG